MKRSSLRFAFSIVTIAASAVLQTGCVAVVAGAAGAGAVAYVRGELRGDVTSALEGTERATGRALEQLQLIKINQKHDAFVSILNARTADDKKVEITLTKRTDQATRVQIRVGFFGDEAKSLAILDKIKANL